MICLDVNVMLEALLKRKKSIESIELITSDEEVAISFLSVHLLYYFGLREKVSLKILDAFMKNILVLKANREVYELAVKIRKGGDFEDALQVASAIYSEVDCFYTLDQNLAKNYQNLLKIKVL
jgi:predicted nucleic acid-binding protein